MAVVNVSIRENPEAFDLDKYLRSSKRVDLSSVEWGRMHEVPLRPEEARAIAYMMDIETHTAIFLRDLLATRAAAEGDVSAFLSCWAYEEYWHGEAFSRFLGEAGWELRPDRDLPTRKAPYPSRVDRISRIRRDIKHNVPITHVATLFGSILNPDFVALHMTWGAINELSTLTAYNRLIARTEHVVLPQMLRCVIKDERRHFAFYRSQAIMRLRRSPRAQKLTRWAVNRFWKPVGTGVRPQSETDFIVRYLFDDEDLKTAAEIDDVLEAMPGMEGLGLARRAVNQARLRAGLAPHHRSVGTVRAR
ncbi:MAG: ferritin-like domain-containing protein [Actinomycetota bacterium]